MQRILPPVDIVQPLLPEADTLPQEEILRCSVFVVEVQMPEGTLLFNTMTKEMILLKDGDIDNADVQTSLWHGMFLVAKSCLEIQNCRQIALLAEMLTPEKNHIVGYTILPTTDCNARCFYCFELNRSRLMMTMETADKVADYIISHKPDGDDAKVHIGWFGGEPLYNVDAIDRITHRLTKAHVAFTSNMVSNGYLFTESLVQSAIDSWNLKRIQITLDGTEQVYNRTKAYIYRGDENPYQRVIRNIGLLAAAGIKVSIRLNIDRQNIDDMFSLVSELSERFEDKKNISIYSHELFEQAGAKVRERSDSERSELYQQQIQLEQLVEDCGFAKKKYHLLRAVKTNHCMADNDSSVTIMPDGHIGKCEHWTDSDFVGYISGTPAGDKDDAGPELDGNAVRAYKERWPEQPECATCAVYPECIRLRKCQEAMICHPEKRLRKLDDIRRAMLAEYDRYKNKQNDGSDAQCDSEAQCDSDEPGNDYNC